MNILYTTKLTKDFGTESEENKQVFTNTIKGGSASKFETPASYNPATKLENDFDVKDCQTFVMELPNGNTLNSNILQFVKTSYEELSFLQITCQDSLSQEKTPIRFKVSIRVNGNVTILELGEMSIFTLGNIKNNKIDQIFVNDILLPNDSSGLLVITLATTNKNS